MEAGNGGATSGGVQISDRAGPLGSKGKVAAAAGMEFMSQRHRSSRILDRALEYELSHRDDVDANHVDLKKLRRTISNRLSAQRSRRKKACQIDSLEKCANDLQKRVALLSSQVEAAKQKQQELLHEKETLQNLIQTRLLESKIHESQLRQKQQEFIRLKEHKKKNNNNESNSSQAIHSYPGLDVYQRGLQKLVRRPGAATTSRPSAAEEEEEEEDIDRFINYDAVDVDPPSFCN